MHINQLKYIIEVYKYQNISLASEHLHLTQQALSLSIKNIEKELGIKIIERSNHGVIFTKEGEEFIQCALDITDRYQEFLEKIQRQDIDKRCSREKNRLNGDLTVYANASFFSSKYIMEMMKRFSCRYSDVKVKFLQKNTLSVYEAFCDSNDIEGKSIVALINLPIISQVVLPAYRPSEGLEFNELKRGRVKLVVGKHHPLARYKQVSLKQAFKFKIIQYAVDDVSRSPLFALLKYYSEFNENDITHYIYSESAYIEMLSSSDYVSFWGDNGIDTKNSLLEKYEDQITMISLKEPLIMAAGYLTRSSLSILEKTFVEMFPQEGL